MSVTDFPAILGKAGAPLSTADTTDLFDAIFTGRLTEQDITFLFLLTLGKADEQEPLILDDRAIGGLYSDVGHATYPFPKSQIATRTRATA